MEDHPNYFLEKMVNAPMGMKWFRFYVNIRFPIGFVLGAIGLMASIGTLFSPFFLIYVLSAGLYILQVSVYKLLKKLDMEGYNRNMILLGVETVVLSIGGGSGLFDGLFFVISLIILSLVWWLPNYIYFKKRRDYLFTGNPVEWEASQDETAE